ncbi:MAG: BatA domain-containing protein [Mariniblastus sp.]
MTWVNLGILGVGGALLSIPIILHFMMKAKPKDIVFPALRFLKEKDISNRSRMRLRHFLLLFLRCLLIGLVAIALAGPSVASSDFGNWLTLGGIGFSGVLVGAVLLLAFFRSTRNWILIGILGLLFVGHLGYGAYAFSKIQGADGGQLIGDDQAPVAALIVVDTSPRMEYLNENQTRIEKAKEMAIWLVGQLPVDSQVCVMATDNDQPFFSVDVAAAKRRIKTLEINYSGTTIPKTMLEGVQLLAKATQERKEIYVVSDLTEVSWVGDSPGQLIRLLDKYKETSLFVIDVGVEEATNFSLTQLNLSSAEISPRQRLVVTTEVQRIGPAAQRGFSMSIEKHDPPLPVVRDDVAVFPSSSYDAQTTTKDIRENGSVSVKFTFSQPLEFGTYHGRVAIEGQDALAVDNERFFTIQVGDVKRTLIVHPENPDRKNPSHVNPRVLESLLAPQDKVKSGTNRYESTTITQEEFINDGDAVGVSDYDAIFLLDPLPLDDAIWERLEGFVESGGGLGIFLGRNASDGGIAHESFRTEAAQRLLSGSLEQQWYNEEADLFLSPKELIHPIFSLVRDSPTNVLWNRFPIFVHWGIEPDGNSKLPTQTLLRFGNREPAVIERVIGSGRVLVMTTPITEYGNAAGKGTWWNALFTDNPVPAWLLVNGMVSHLVQTDASSLNIEVGQPASFGNDLREFPESYQVFTPKSDRRPTDINTLDGARIRFRFTDYPGHYRIKGRLNREVILRGFSANLKQSTTDLTRMTPDKLDSFLGPERYQLASQESEIQRQQGATRRGQEFFPLAMLMALVVMAVEYLMSNRFYKS